MSVTPLAESLKSDLEDAEDACFPSDVFTSYKFHLLFFVCFQQLKQGCGERSTSFAPCLPVSIVQNQVSKNEGVVRIQCLL